MNRRIPNGAWCLFQLNPHGTRTNQIVVAQHHSIRDPELGSNYTIKIYSSKKVMSPEGEWRHTEIRLSPDSDRPDFKPIVIRENAEGEFRIIAQLLHVLR